jgi:hypothetical protein
MTRPVVVNVYGLVRSRRGVVVIVTWMGDPRTMDGAVVWALPEATYSEEAARQTPPPES